MSELDEGLDEIMENNHVRKISPSGESDRFSFSDEQWLEIKQAILDLMCKHRGCEPKKIPLTPDKWGYDPCIWCGKEKG